MRHSLRRFESHHSLRTVCAVRGAGGETVRRGRRQGKGISVSIKGKGPDQEGPKGNGVNSKELTSVTKHQSWGPRGQK